MEAYTRTHWAWWALTWRRLKSPGWNVVVYSNLSWKKKTVVWRTLRRWCTHTQHRSMARLKHSFHASTTWARTWRGKFFSAKILLPCVRKNNNEAPYTINTLVLSSPAPSHGPDTSNRWSPQPSGRVVSFVTWYQPCHRRSGCDQNILDVGKTLNGICMPSLECKHICSGINGSRARASKCCWTNSFCRMDHPKICSA